MFRVAQMVALGTGNGGKTGELRGIDDSSVAALSMTWGSERNVRTDSGSSVRKDVEVQVLSSAPIGSIACETSSGSTPIMGAAPFLTEPKNTLP